MFTEPMNTPYWLSPYMMSDEELLWTGQPDPKNILNTRDIIMIPFALAVGIPVTLILPADPRLYGAAALVWIIAIVYVIFGRFYSRYRAKKRTFYALTNRRAMVLSLRDDEAALVKNLPFETIVAVTHSQTNDELGTVAFELVMPEKIKISKDKYSLGLSSPVFNSEAPAFFDIRDSEEVYKTIYQIRYRNYRHILGDWSDSSSRNGSASRS